MNEGTAVVAAPPATPAATKEDVAAIVAQALRATQPAAAAPEPRQSAYDALMAKLEVNASDDDRPTIDLHKNIHGAMKKDIVSEIVEQHRQESWQQIVTERENQAVDFIESEIESRYSDEPADDRNKIVSILKKEIADEVRTKSQGEYQQLLQRIAKGEKCKSELKELVDKHAKDFDKLTKRESRSTTGRAPSGLGSGASSAQASVAGGKAEGPVDVKQLSQAQREWFYETERQALSVGYKPDEARAYAFTRASNTPKGK